jgi:hypothetical protein
MAAMPVISVANAPSCSYHQAFGAEPLILQGCLDTWCNRVPVVHYSTHYDKYLPPTCTAIVTLYGSTSPPGTLLRFKSLRLE